MYRNILVPLDGANFSEHSLPYALAIARRAGANLHLLHVQAPLESEFIEVYSYGNDLMSVLIERNQRYLENVVANLKEQGFISVSASVKVGTIADSIHNYAAEFGIDLIVMTTHGRGPFARFWLGSTADALLRECSVPLLLVKPASSGPAELGKDIALKRLLVPLDGTPLAEQIIDPATDLGNLFSAEYTLLRAVKPFVPVMETVEFREATHRLLEDLRRLHEQARNNAQKYLDAVAGRLRGRSLKVSAQVVNAESPAEAILHKATLPEDAVCLATHGRSGLPRIFVGSVADKVVRGSHLPVLLYRPK